MRTSALIGAKIQIFRNFWYVSTDKGVETVRTFCGRGVGGSIFLDYVWTSYKYSSILKSLGEN